MDIIAFQGPRQSIPRKLLNIFPYLNVTNNLILRFLGPQNIRYDYQKSIRFFPDKKSHPSSWIFLFQSLNDDVMLSLFFSSLYLPTPLHILPVIILCKLRTSIKSTVFEWACGYITWKPCKLGRRSHICWLALQCAQLVAPSRICPRTKRNWHSSDHIEKSLVYDCSLATVLS